VAKQRNNTTGRCPPAHGGRLAVGSDQRPAAQRGDRAPPLPQAGPPKASSKPIRWVPGKGEAERRSGVVAETATTTHGQVRSRAGPATWGPGGQASARKTTPANAVSLVQPLNREGAARSQPGAGREVRGCHPRQCTNTRLASSRAKAPGKHPPAPRRATSGKLAAPGPAGFLKQVQLGGAQGGGQSAARGCCERPAKRLQSQGCQGLPRWAPETGGAKEVAIKSLKPSTSP